MSTEKGQEARLLRRVAAWLANDAPLISGLEWLLDWLEFSAQHLGCLLHGHEPFIEMNRVSVCCAYCRAELMRGRDFEDARRIEQSLKEPTR